jgi:hypothetical protein
VDQERSDGLTEVAGQAVLLTVGTAIALGLAGAIAFVWGVGWCVLSIASMFEGHTRHEDEPIHRG